MASVEYATLRKKRIMKTKFAETIPHAVYQRVKHRGPIAQTWLEQIPDAVAELESAWDITVGALYRDGSDSLVFSAQNGSEKHCVLKMQMPKTQSEPTTEVEALRAAAGYGYVKLIAHDNARKALLLERLGAPIAHAGLSTEAQVEAICVALQTSWQATSDPAVSSAKSLHSLTPGTVKADWLAKFIPHVWNALDQPCSAALVDLALRFIDDRRGAWQPDSWVLSHGDLHEFNVLASGGEDDQRFKLVDPEGLRFEASYDLGMLMRNWPEEYDAARDAIGKADVALRRCRFIAASSGCAETPIWRWGYVETLSTSLHLIELGFDAEGRAMLALAKAMQMVSI